MQASSRHRPRRSRDWLDVCIELRPKIEKALAFHGNTHSFEELIQAIATRRLQIFFDDHSILLVEIVQFPRLKVCSPLLVAGNLKDVVKLIREAEEWARDIGCQRIQSTGQIGWRAIAKELGWRINPRPFVNVMKEL